MRIPDQALLAEIRAIYERGRTLDALERAEVFAPLRQWGGVAPRLIAARIAANCGAPALSLRLCAAAWRANRLDPEALSQYAYETLGRRGPLAAWTLLRAVVIEESPQGAELFALQASAAVALRDFSTGERLISKAEALAPQNAWIHLQRAWYLERLDRVDEALAVARAAATLHPHPFYRPATQTCAHLLQVLDRDDEAVGLLQEAMLTLQNGPIALQLYAILSENGRWTEAAAVLRQYVGLAPLLEPAGGKWLRAQQARVAYHLGKRAAAATFAGTLSDAFHESFAKRLRELPPQPERVQLDIGFVRQHYKTCAPATLAAIARYWRMPADHVQLTEAMCYDGTPAWQQREWATNNGWLVREFRVTAECVEALLLAELPFAISAVEATSAHMMAVIGFDRTRDVLLLRDPSQPYVIESPTGEFLRRYRAFGPRGMIFVPLPQAERLNGIELPECDLYDHYHQLSRALVAHERDRASGELAHMERIGPDEALTWQARLDFATYDANTFEQLRCIDRLLEMFPGNPARLLSRLDCMRDASREHRIKLLDTACKLPGVDPALQVAMARALSMDARQSDEAQRWLRRALRKCPTDHGAIKASADLLWEAARLDEATEHYRFAASVDGQQEHLYQSWFIACRRTGRTEEALADLEDRYRRFGARSDQPALTLAWALNEMDQPHRAREVLQDAIRLRPGDGSLVLRAASLAASVGDAANAHELLELARGKTRENDWLRARLQIAEQQMNTDSMLECARALLQLDPLAIDAHAALARAIARREGSAAARGALQGACSTYPHNCGLNRLLVEWSRDADPGVAIEAARELLRLEPSDAWAYRELALAFLRLERGDDALAAALEAARIEPANSYSASTLAQVHRRMGHREEAREQLRKAIAASVDNNFAIESLLALARTDDERRTDLVFVERELLRQVVGGDGLLAYLEFARPIVDSDQLLGFLRHAHSVRPDLWHAWGALVSQLIHMSRLDEALSIASQATQRFPHLPRSWCDLASVHQRRREVEAEITALARAFELNPAWSYCARSLADALERAGRIADAQVTYERALRHSPRDTYLWTAHAAVLWRRQMPAEALTAVEHALLIAPDYQHAWEQLSDWAAQCGDGERATRFARELLKKHSGEPSVWLMLARTLPVSAPEERIDAAKRAVDLDRRSALAWDLWAELLTLAERFDDAAGVCRQGEAACAADAFMLSGRRAWIEAQRGRIPDAIKSMREVLATNRGYSWGWYQLVYWLTQTELLAEAEAALETMRQMWPHDSWVHRQLAVLLLKRKDTEAAKAAFSKALELAPNDINAAHNLLQLQLQTSDFAGGLATLQTMQLHQPGTYTLAAEIDLRLAQDDLDSAARCLGTLATLPDPDPWPIDSAVETFQRTFHYGQAKRVLERAVRSRDANPQVAAALIRLYANAGSFLSAARLFMKLPAGEQQRRAAAPLMQLLSENDKKALFRWVLRRKADVLKADAAAWGQVGYGLTRFGMLARVADWLADWRGRDGVQPWMLFNYCLALRDVGRYSESVEVARHVIDHWAHRDGSSDMHLYLAVEAALAGAVRDARQHLERATVRENVAYDQQLLALAHALTEFHEAEPGLRGRLFPKIRERLNPQFSGYRFARSMRDARRTFVRAAEVFVREGAGPFAWMWFRWKLHWRWTYVVAPLASVGLIYNSFTQ